MSKEIKVEVGKDVLSYCGRCKMPLVHTILSLTKKDTVDRCECNTCGAAHKYRDPDKVKAKGAAKTRKAAVSPEVLWNEAMAQVSGLALPYDMSSEFILGALIEHASFGKGAVQEVIEPNKIRVIFELGEKILIHKR